MTHPVLRRLFAATLTGAAMLALGGCGHSTPADAPASADNVEMPAEEALSGVTAQPSADPEAAASDAVSDTSSAAAAPGEAASGQ